MRALRSLLLPILLGLALLAVAVVTRTGILERKNPGRPINSAMREAMGQMVWPAADRETVELRFPQAQTHASGMRYLVQQSGSGPTPKRGQYLAIHYRESLLDGTVVEDTHTRGEGPFNFQFGTRRVMPAWEESLAEMSKGAKWTVIAPYWLAYGEKGVRGKVPPKSTLILELELVDIR